MIRLLISAALTGAFCAGFTVAIDYVTDMLAQGQVIALSFVSGFCGSVFSQAIQRRVRQ